MMAQERDLGEIIMPQVADLESTGIDPLSSVEANVRRRRLGRADGLGHLGSFAQPWFGIGILNTVCNWYVHL
jgi:hypothetical protein